jgi:amidase
MDHASGESFPLQAADGPTNPVTGPLFVEHAEPGDTLSVRIARIALDSRGWCGSHADVGGFRPGSIPNPLGRVCEIRDGTIFFSDHLQIPVQPFVGCLGTAPTEPASTQSAGRHGGNLDHPIIGEGAVVYLPVFEAGGRLFAGDVHAAQGDGELSGVALEAAAVVTIEVDLIKGRVVRWPWVRNHSRLAVCTAAASFEQAREEAIEELLSATTRSLGLQPAEAMALISVAGDLRIGAAWGAPEYTLRLEMPSSIGITPW